MVRNLKRKIEILIYKINHDNIQEYAAECSFFIILSAVPGLMFFMTLVKYINLDEMIIFEFIQNIMPVYMYEFIKNVIDEVYSKSLKTLSFSAFFTLWSASKGLFSINKCFKKINKVNMPKNRIFLKITCTLYTFIFLIIFLIILYIILFLKMSYNFLRIKKSTLFFIIEYIFKFKIVIISIVFFIFIFLLYKILDNEKNKFKNQVLGIFFSTLIWTCVSIFFSIYVDVFDGFENMYGSLSNIILIMLWIYIFIYIILIGAEINYIYRKIK